MHQMHLLYRSQGHWTVAKATLHERHLLVNCILSDGTLNATSKMSHSQDDEKILYARLKEERGIWSHWVEVSGIQSSQSKMVRTRSQMGLGRVVRRWTGGQWVRALFRLSFPFWRDLLRAGHVVGGWSLHFYLALSFITGRHSFKRERWSLQNSHICWCKIPASANLLILEGCVFSNTSLLSAVYYYQSHFLASSNLLELRRRIALQLWPYYCGRTLGQVRFCETTHHSVDVRPSWVCHKNVQR